MTLILFNLPLPLVLIILELNVLAVLLPRLLLPFVVYALNLILLVIKRFAVHHLSLLHLLLLLLDSALLNLVLMLNYSTPFVEHFLLLLYRKVTSHHWRFWCLINPVWSLVVCKLRRLALDSSVSRLTALYLRILA